MNRTLVAVGVSALCLAFGATTALADGGSGSSASQSSATSQLVPVAASVPVTVPVNASVPIAVGSDLPEAPVVGGVLTVAGGALADPVGTVTGALGDPVGALTGTLGAILG